MFRLRKLLDDTAARLEPRLLRGISGFGQQLQNFLESGALLAVRLLAVEKRGDLEPDRVDFAGEFHVSHLLSPFGGAFRPQCRGPRPAATNS